MGFVNIISMGVDAKSTKTGLYNDTEGGEMETVDDSSNRKNIFLLCRSMAFPLCMIIALVAVFPT
jgi:hypothetical protein